MTHQVSHDAGEGKDMATGSDLRAQGWAFQRYGTLQGLIHEHFHLQEYACCVSTAVVQGIRMVSKVGGEKNDCRERTRYRSLPKHASQHDSMYSRSP